MTAPAPRPKRTGLAPRWWPDDLVQIDGVRWVIRIVDHQTGHVELESMSDVNARWWTTTVDKLPDPPGGPA